MNRGTVLISAAGNNRVGEVRGTRWNRMRNQKWVWQIATVVWRKMLFNKNCKVLLRMVIIREFWLKRAWKIASTGHELTYPVMYQQECLKTWRNPSNLISTGNVLPMIILYLAWSPKLQENSEPFRKGPKETEEKKESSKALEPNLWGKTVLYLCEGSKEMVDFKKCLTKGINLLSTFTSDKTEDLELQFQAEWFMLGPSNSWGI